MKSLARYKVFSGALQFTIFIGVIIALLLAGLVMLQNTHNFFIQQSKATIENIQLANSGMNFLLNQKETISDTITLEQISNESQKVQVQLSQWGIYEMATVKTIHREKIFYKSALLGTKMLTKVRPTLYLQDKFKPLIIVGNTVLKGTVFIPDKNISAGYIAGENFSGRELVQGTVKNSDAELPRLKKGYKLKLEQFMNNVNFKPENFIGENEVLKATNSFLRPTKVLYNKGIIELSNNQLTGNFFIKSEVLIRVKKTAILKDIILIAPIIEIDDGVCGNFQAFATKKIIIGENCKLNYPSALVLMQEENNINFASQNDYQISIDKNTEIKGTVCVFKPVDESDFNTQLLLNETAIIKGEVYCQGNFDLKGKVIGSVFTSQFIVKKAGSVFINHIYNGQIVDDNFPESFCGILLEDSVKGIVKWIY